MSSFRTHYENLQIAENASIDVIKGAYKFLSQKWHPDKHPDNKERAEHIMRIINDAYDVLSSPEKRKQHDVWIAETRKKIDADTVQPDQGQQSKQGQNEQASNHAEAFTEDPEADESQWDVPKASSQTESGTEFLNPWRRFAARLIDLFLFVLVLEVITNYWPGETLTIGELLDNRVTMLMVSVVLWVPLETVFLFAFGATPAKWLLGIHVHRIHGNTPGMAEAFQRSLGVCILGMACGIPLVIFIANFYSLKRLANTGLTLWDEPLGLVVTCKKLTALHMTLAITATLAIVTLVVAGQAEDKILLQPTKMFASDIPAKVDSSLPALQISNACQHTIKLALSYVDLNGQRRTDGWWYVKPDESRKFVDESNNHITTNIPEWYFYARTVSGPDVIWEGQYKFTLFGSELPMQKVEDKDESRTWSIKCPDAPGQVNVPIQKASPPGNKAKVSREGNGCTIKGIMTDEELARCRGF